MAATRELGEQQSCQAKPCSHTTYPGIQGQMLDVAIDRGVDSAMVLALIAICDRINKGCANRQHQLMVFRIFAWLDVKRIHNLDILL